MQDQEGGGGVEGECCCRLCSVGLVLGERVELGGCGKQRLTDSVTHGRSPYRRSLASSAMRV